MFLTDRQLCKRGELKVALSPEPPEIHTDTPSCGEDRWPSSLLIIKAASCNIKKRSSTQLQGAQVEIIHQPKYYGSWDVEVATEVRPLKTFHQHHRITVKNKQPNLKRLLINRQSSVLDV